MAHIVSGYTHDLGWAGSGDKRECRLIKSKGGLERWGLQLEIFTFLGYLARKRERQPLSQGKVLFLEATFLPAVTNGKL